MFSCLRTWHTHKKTFFSSHLIGGLDLSSPRPRLLLLLSLFPSSSERVFTPQLTKFSTSKHRDPFLLSRMLQLLWERCRGSVTTVLQSIMRPIRLSKQNVTWLLCFVCRNYRKQRRDFTITTLPPLAFINFCFLGRELSVECRACNFPVSARKHNVWDLLHICLHRLRGARRGGTRTRSER